ncbi:MAG: hypothetical protein AB1894_28985 [Chloroflexota bacterium]
MICLPILALILCACKPAPAAQTPTVNREAAGAVTLTTSPPPASPTASATPKQTTGLPTRTPGKPTAETPGKGLAPTQTRIPTRTPVPALPRSLSEAKLPLARDGTPLPENLAVIAPENLLELSELGRWGKGEIITLAYSPDGSQIAVATNQGVYFYAADDGYKLIRFVPFERLRLPLAISSSLHYLAKEGADGCVEIWDLQSGQLFRSLQTNGYSVLVIAFTPDESRVFASDEAQEGRQYEKTYSWNVQTGQLLETFSRGAEELIFSADGQTWVSVRDLQVMLWRAGDPSNPQQIASTAYFRDPIALSPDGELLALQNNQNWDMRIEIWRVSTGSLWQTFYMQAPQGGAALKVRAAPPKSPAQLSGPGKYVVTGLAFSPDGQKLAALNGFGLLHQWRLQDGALLRVTPTQSWYVTYSPPGNTLATWRYTASFYLSQGNQAVYVLDNYAGPVNDLAFAPDGRSLAIGSRDGKVWWRSLQDGNVSRAFKTQPVNLSEPYSSNAINVLDYAEDGAWIAAGTFDGQVYLWSTGEEQQQVFASPCQYDWVMTISLSFDNRYLAFQRYECPSEIIDLKEKTTQVFDPRQPGYKYTPLTFSPTASWLAASTNKGIALLNAPKLTPIANLWEIKTLMGSPTPRFSADGQLLAFGDDEGRFEVWKVNGQRLVIRVKGRDPVERFAISPDNRLLATSYGRDITLYDLNSGQALGLLASGGPALDFSPDGRLLAVGGEDGVVYIYGIPLSP